MIFEVECDTTKDERTYGPDGAHNDCSFYCIRLNITNRSECQVRTPPWHLGTTMCEGSTRSGITLAGPRPGAAPATATATSRRLQRCAYSSAVCRASAAARDTSEHEEGEAGLVRVRARLASRVQCSHDMSAYCLVSVKSRTE